MLKITIEVKWNMMKVHEGKMKKSRLAWTGPGCEIYAIGELKGGKYGEVANLAMNWAEGVHIAPSSLRRAGAVARQVSTKSVLISNEGLSLKKTLF